MESVHYIIVGVSLSGSTSLNQPDFGGRINRLDAVEKLLQEHGVAKTISVHYDPGNPQNSTLSPGLPMPCLQSSAIPDYCLQLD